MSTGEKQKGSLVYENPLQKGKLLIQKEDDEGQPVSGAVFSVTAAQDIYAPWDVKEDGTPASDTKPLVTKGEVQPEKMEKEKAISHYILVNIS